MTIRNRNARRVCLLVAAGVLVLTGCGEVHPGTAASVGADTIGHDEVDALASTLCAVGSAGAAAQGQPAPETATKVNREAALGLLLENSLSSQFGEQEGVEPDPGEVSQALAASEANVGLLPEGEQEDLRAAIQDFEEGRSILISVGRESLEESGRSEVSDEQALAEGQRLRAQFVRRLDIDVDPRYGSYERGALQPGSQSLSVPASEEAVAGARAEPGPSFVSALPASQKCS